MLVVPSRFQPTSLHFVPMMEPHHGKLHALLAIRWIPVRSLKRQVSQRRSMGRSSCNESVWRWGIISCACCTIMDAHPVLEVYLWSVNMLGCFGCPHNDSFVLLRRGWYTNASSHPHDVKMAIPFAVLILLRHEYVNLPNGINSRQKY